MEKVTEIVLLSGATVALIDALFSKQEKRNFSFTIAFVLFVLLIVAIKIF